MKRNSRRKKLISIVTAMCMALSLLPSFALAAVYQGDLDDTGTAKGSVKVTLQYQYSPTGGMAGINAHAAETVEFFLNEDGTTTPAAWPIPYYDAEGNNEHHDHDHHNLQGFRVVLNAAPLNAFLVKPPTGNESEAELEAALNRGDFNPDPEKMKNEAAVEQAWIDGRTFTDESGLIFQVVDKDGDPANGSDALVGPKLILQNPEKLEELDRGTEITLAVNYRRDNGTYTVKHWLRNITDSDWELQADKTEVKQGRIGAMTHAEAQFIPGYMNMAVSQQPIAADGSTVVNVYYTQDTTIRVVFDTSDCEGEIVRQTPNVGEKVVFSKDATPAPTKEGYIFAGWEYQKKDGTLALVTEAAQYDAATDTLTVNEDFLNQAYFQPSEETAGVNVLRLYPRWEPGTTRVRVVFWTEDLTGTDDVDSREKGAPGELTVKTHRYDERGAAYSNVGYAWLEGVRTDCELDVDTATGQLNYQAAGTGAAASMDLRTELAELETMKITTSFDMSQPSGLTDAEKEDPTKWDKDDETKCDLTDSSMFFTLDGFVVTQMEGAPKDMREGNQAANTGTTVVNVYYTRNIYKLEFIYSTTTGGKPVVAVHTRGYANRNESENAAANTRREIATQEDADNIPARQVVTAKYGADLRGVWPYHRDLMVNIQNNNVATDKGLEARFLSWTTTKGPYNAQARWLGLFREGSASEPTIMGVYGAMSADIIAEPSLHINADNYTEQEGTHRLYAYWSDWQRNSFYQYNHCYEVPGVTREMLEAEGEKVVLDNQEDEENVRNVGYLIPADGNSQVMELIKQYGFSDLRRVQVDRDKGANGVVVADDGDYYGFRVYNDKCYALSRQVNVVSTNTVEAQSPSARSHMLRVNNVPDHSTAYTNSSGGFRENTAVGTADDPCQLFFYYDRIPYTILYSVGADDLGTKELYYGAKLSAEYRIEMESGVSPDGSTNVVETNGEYAVSDENPNGWKLPTGNDGQVNVCPGRSPRGTKEWRFKGWAMDLAGTALLDSDEDWNGVVSGDLHLYAQWEAPKYTVIFDWNGGHLAFGSEEDYKEQEVSANSSVTFGAMAPTPVQPGYYLTGWKIIEYDLDGNGTWTPVKKDWPFHFDDQLTFSLKVQAQWEKIPGAEEFTYTVRHVLDSNKAVKIAEDETVTGSFVPGSQVWGNPTRLGTYQGKDYSGYVPTVQHAASQVPTEEGGAIAPIVITYRPPTAEDAYRYTVKLKDAAGKVLHTEEIKTAEATKTIYGGAYAALLDEKGYWLADGDGKQIALGDDSLLKTLDAGGTAEFLAAPEVFTIGYDWTNLDAAVAATLDAGLPHDYSPVDGALTLPVPGENGTYQYEGKIYGFTGWKLTQGKLQGDDDSTGKVFDTVTIDPESRGALAFQTQWAEESRSVVFQPGSHGGFTDNETAVSFNGLADRPLGKQKEDKGFAVPAVTAEKGYCFTGWKLEGDAESKLYTAQEIEGLTPAVGRMVFTAQYRKESGGGTSSSTTPTETPKLETEAHTAYIVGRDGGLVAPEASITRAEVVTIFYRLLTEESRKEFATRENPFPDVSPEDWYFEAAATMAKAGIVKGYSDGRFGAEDNISRGEFAAIAARFLSEPYTGETHFSDTDGHWAAEEIDRAAQAGWIKGYPDGSFRPVAAITRAEAITLVNAVLGRAPHKDGLHKDMVTWPDNANTGAWYYLAVQEATNSHEYTWQTVSGQQMEKWTKVEK